MLVKDDDWQGDQGGDKSARKIEKNLEEKCNEKLTDTKRKAVYKKFSEQFSMYFRLGTYGDSATGSRSKSRTDCLRAAGTLEDEAEEKAEAQAGDAHGVDPGGLRSDRPAL